MRGRRHDDCLDDWSDRHRDPGDADPAHEPPAIQLRRLRVCLRIARFEQSTRLKLIQGDDHELAIGRDRVEEPSELGDRVPAIGQLPDLGRRAIQAADQLLPRVIDENLVVELGRDQIVVSCLRTHLGAIGSGKAATYVDHSSNVVETNRRVNPTGRRDPP